MKASMLIRQLIGLAIITASLSSTAIAESKKKPELPALPPGLTLPPGVEPEYSSIFTPLELTPEALAESLKSMSSAPLISDDDCMYPPEVIETTKLQVTSADAGTCAGRDKEIVVRGSTHGLYACSQGKIALTMRVSLGKNGMGKEKEGDNKNPLGTYWLGYPRASKDYGIFIPVGYPNYDDLVARRTGNSIGIHGPNRFGACLAKAMIQKDWTQGCVGAARDAQIVDVANWVLENWPVRVTITRK